MNRVDGKVCVISGATQGLGAAIARRLAAAGAAGIIITGRNQERGTAVAEGIAATCGVTALFVRGNLGSVEDCRRMIAEADSRFGRMNVLVNAGASTERGTILDTSPELFDRMFAINVRGPFFLMQEAIKLMIRDNIEGAICNIGSMSALSGQPFVNGFSVVKCPILRPARMVSLPYRCSAPGVLAYFPQSAASSPMMFSITASAWRTGSPSGQPATARICCSN